MHGVNETGMGNLLLVLIIISVVLHMRAILYVQVVAGIRCCERNEDAATRSVLWSATDGSSVTRNKNCVCALEFEAIIVCPQEIAQIKRATTRALCFKHQARAAEQNKTQTRTDTYRHRSRRRVPGFGTPASQRKQSRASTVVF